MRELTVVRPDEETAGPPPEPAVSGDASGRVPALDVLRGIAILGTLATNIGAFVMVGQEPLIDGAVNSAISYLYGLVTNGYWIGLLTIMFGIGLTIQRESAVRRGEPWLGSYPWRAVLLIIEGFLNYLFIVQFDVLMGYGITALVLCVVLMTPRRFQTIVLALGVAAHLGYLTYLTVSTASMVSRFADGDVVGFREGGSIEAVPAAVDGVELPESGASEIRSVVEGAGDFGYWDSVRMNLELFWHGGRHEIPIMILMGIGVFLIGGRLWEAGIFRPDGARLRKRVMWIGFGLGLPVDWGLRTLMFFDDDGTVAAWTANYVRYVTATVVAFGILALVAHFYAGRDSTGRVGSKLALVGQMALTNYLLQNLLGVVLFGPFFLNLRSHIPFSLGALDLVIGAALMGTVLIVFSSLWLRRFERGPMETLSHAAHRWLVDNTTRRVTDRRRPQPAS